LDKSSSSLLVKKVQEAYAFCIFSEPGKLSSELYIQDNLQQEIPKEGFCFSPFVEDLDSPAIYISSERKRKLEDVDFNWLAKVNLPLLDKAINDTSFAAYESAFDKFSNELNSDSELEKLVLSRVKDLPWNGNPFLLFRKLKNRYPENFVYLLFHPVAGVWLAASPETLVNVRSNIVKTMALAGTQLPNSKGVVTWGEKEIDEHNFVVDYIAETLNNAGCDEVQVSKAETVRAGKVYHLMTPIIGALGKELNWLNLSQELHPTPAVCGTPKGIAREFILNNEGHKRSYYCGYVGPYSENEVNLFVNLRCMSLFENKVSLFLGGGITRASVLMDEWNETENKALTLLDCLKEN